MKSVKLIVAYPQLKDASAFGKIYQQEHIPMAVAKLQGKTKIVATKILQSPQGQPQFYRVAEFIFHPSSYSSSARSLPEARKPWPMR
jgi:hypothetical protein